jgi:hypothetical protein
MPRGVDQVTGTKDYGLLSRPENFWEAFGGCPRRAAHRVFRSTLQGYKPIDCQPLTVI